MKTLEAWIKKKQELIGGDYSPSGHKLHSEAEEISNEDFTIAQKGFRMSELQMDNDLD